MHTIAVFMPGPWELLICAVVAVIAVGVVAAIVVVAVVLAKRKDEPALPPSVPPHDASPPPDAAPPSDTDAPA
jgi:hypothetical protein